MHLTEEPKPGDVVLLCGHGDEHHVYKFSAPVRTITPWGYSLFAQWIAACDACFEKCGPNNAASIRITNHGIWRGETRDV